MSETTYYKRNREIISNRAKDYYEHNKEVLRKRGRNRYRKLCEDEKNIKREYGRNRYHIMSKEKKQRLNKDYCEANKSEKSWFLVKQYINGFFNFMDLIVLLYALVIQY